MSMEPLVTALLDLAHELPMLPCPILVGGGFGLYLKQRHLEEQLELETVIPGKLWPPARSTEDVDLMLPTEVIVSLDYMQAIRHALAQLGYKPTADYFQFARQTPNGPVKIDLLTCDVSTQDKPKVKVNSPRVRPRGPVKLHAFLTKEALALGLSPFELTLTGTRSDNTPDQLLVSIPNTFTYLLMKLHAFRDRANDKGKNLARHHALDLYRIIAMMTREEYDLVKSLSKQHETTEPVIKATAIIQTEFADERSLGVLRLLAASDKSGLQRTDVCVEDFISTMKELFPQ